MSSTDQIQQKSGEIEVLSENTRRFIKNVDAINHMIEQGVSNVTSDLRLSLSEFNKLFSTNVVDQKNGIEAIPKSSLLKFFDKDYDSPPPGLGHAPKSTYSDSSDSNHLPTSLSANNILGSNDWDKKTPSEQEAQLQREISTWDKPLLKTKALSDPPKLKVGSSNQPGQSPKIVEVGSNSYKQISAKKENGIKGNEEEDLKNMGYGVRTTGFPWGCGNDELEAWIKPWKLHSKVPSRKIRDASIKEVVVFLNFTDSNTAIEAAKKNK